MAPLFDLWQAASHASPHHLSDDQRREMAFAFRDQHLAGARLVVAVSNQDAVIGCLGYEADENGALVGGLWVDPERQGDGVGRRLIDRLRARHDQVEATVNFGARDLRGFYEALGFEEAGRDGADGAGAYPDVTLVWKAGTS